MSDSEDDAAGENSLAGFLFGNVDENNNLDADYLDPEVRDQLGALRDERLGLGEHLQELDESKEKGGKKQARTEGEVKKAEGAINFYEEDELVDYTPAAADTRLRHTEKNGGSFGKAPGGRALDRKPRPAPTELELPVLATGGGTTFLRFSQLFAESAQPQALHSKALSRRAPQDALEEGSDEEQLLHASLPAPSRPESEAESSGPDEEEAPTAAAAPQGPQSPTKAAQPPAPVTKPVTKRRKGRKSTAATTGGAAAASLQQLLIPADLLESLQLAEWEGRVDWGEHSDGAGKGFEPEEEEEEEGPMEIAGFDGEPAKNAGRAALEDRRRSNGSASTSYRQAVPWEEGSAWEADIEWDSEHDTPRQPVVPDMNDPHLIFRLVEASDDAEMLDRAAAIVLPALPQVRHSGAAPLGKGRVLELLARQNVSLDEEYMRRRTRKGALLTNKHRHAVPAMQLLTLPPKFLDLREYQHRPRGQWLPLPSKGRAKAKEGEKSTVKILSLVGPAKLAANRVFKGVDLSATTLAMLWDVMKAGAKFADCAALAPPQLALWYRGSQPHALKLDVPIAESGALPDANMELSLVVSGVRYVTTPKALAVPDALIGTPVPVAYQKSKQLTAADGHIMLLEYMEEHPLLLSRPGMAVKACTYYRRTDESDTGHHDLLQEERWKTGAVEALGPGEDSPFFLGDVAPGSGRLAVESNMYRTPAAAHPVASSDFLLIRNASGALSLREVTGSLAVGQQEPLRRIPQPNSKEARDLEEARMVVHVLRELRRQKTRLEKRKLEGEATVTVRELSDLFPDLSDGVIRSRLRDRCSCVPFKDDAAGTYKLADGVVIADERELRQLLRPEDWCGMESMTAGLLRLAAAGVVRPERLAALPLERLRLSLEQLSPPEDYAAAAAELELAIQTTPWTLTDNFVSAMRDGKGALALSGAGDPTSRGEGFSFIRETPKTAAERAAEVLPASVKDGNITGTNKDLRRLTMSESKAILIKLGLSEEDIKGLSRWERIAAVRDLSTAAAAEEGGELGKLGTRYARVAKASSEEQMRIRRIQAQQIFDRQITALTRVEEEGLSDEESWGDELEKELETEEAESQPAGKKKPNKDEEDEEELEEVEELRKGGFLQGEGALAKGKAKLEAKPGERRIKRTITYPDAQGKPATRVIYFTEKDKVQALNDLYRGEGGQSGAGFCKRTISGAGVVMEADDLYDGAAPRKAKKNMSRVQCKACGQMGHYKSNKSCPLYEQTYGKAAKEKAAKAAAEQPPEEKLKITLNTASLGVPVKRKEIWEGPPAKRARGEESGATGACKQLGTRVLCRAIATATHMLPEPVWAPFKVAVTKTSAPDYSQFVAPGEEMHLDKIEKKARSGQYSSGADLLADFRKIVSNAAAYNAPGAGKYGGPAIVAWAEQLAAAVEGVLKDPEYAPLLEECEQAVRAELEAVDQPVDVDPSEDATAEAVEGGGGGSLEQWVQCSKCQKWRRISQKVADETVASAADAPWFCEWDYERAGASCDLPEDTEAGAAG